MSKWSAIMHQSSVSQQHKEGRGLAASALSLPLFTRVRGIGILRTSPLADSPKFAPSVACWHHMYRWKATAHSVYEREEGENAMHVEGITWHALTLEADEFGATKKLLMEVFGLRPAIDTDGWTMFPMSNGTILELCAPGAIPAYGFNEGGIVFGFRVDDIEAASRNWLRPDASFWGVTRIEEKNYAYRDFRGPDGRVYGINERK